MTLSSTTAWRAIHATRTGPTSVGTAPRLGESLVAAGDSSGNAQVPPTVSCALPSTFVPDQDHLDTTSVSGRKFLKYVQSTPWSVKAGLAGTEVSQLRVTDLTRKGLHEFRLRCLSRDWRSPEVSVKLFLSPICCECATSKNGQQLQQHAWSGSPGQASGQLPTHAATHFALHRPFVSMSLLPHLLPTHIKSSSTRAGSWKLQESP